MEGYDLLMLAVLLGATAFGAYKGLAWQIASISSLVVSYYVALQFREPVSTMIKANPPWNIFLAMLILFVGCSFAIWTGFRFVSQMIDRVRLKEFDRQIGALFGFAKGALLCIIVTLFAVTLSGEAQRQSIVRSKSGHYIAGLLAKSDQFIPDEAREVLDPYVDRLNDELRQVRHDDPSPNLWNLPFDRSSDAGREEQGGGGADSLLERLPQWLDSRRGSADNQTPIVPRGLPLDIRPQNDGGYEIRFGGAE